MAEGKKVVLHCVSGNKRSGLVAGCCLLALGVPISSAISEVQQLRPKALRNPIDLLTLSLFKSAFDKKRSERLAKVSTYQFESDPSPTSSSSSTSASSSSSSSFPPSITTTSLLDSSVGTGNNGLERNSLRTAEGMEKHPTLSPGGTEGGSYADFRSDTPTATPYDRNRGYRFES